jgi:L-lactate dehydrogenase complex protein LldG
LNKGESLHALRRDLFFAHQGQVRRRHLDDQVDRHCASRWSPVPLLPPDLLDGRPRHDQIAVVADPDQTLTRRVGEYSVQLANHGVELDAVGGVITGCAVAAAETGTLVFDASADQGRRVITLVPDHHLCMLGTDAIEADIPEALTRLTLERPLTMISGPSATSDIELNRRTL